MTPKQQYHKTLATAVIKDLEKRQMKGYYCQTKEEALEQAISLLHDGATISWGGSESLKEVGLVKALEKGDYNLLDRSVATTEEEQLEVQRRSFFSDFYFLSCNAMTRDGIIYNVDGSGNRVAAMIYGPKEVIMIVGINKICLNDEEANKRVRNVAAPINTIRLKKDTPCAKLGTCMECLTPDTICSHTVITRYSKPKNRIKVIIVGEELGY